VFICVVLFRVTAYVKDTTCIFGVIFCVISDVVIFCRHFLSQCLCIRNNINVDEGEGTGDRIQS
jgi:hypothetical protein